MSIDAQIDQYFKPVADAVFGFIFFEVPIGWGSQVPFLLLWLFAVAAFLTVYLGFINFRYFGHAIDIVRGKFDNEKGADGQISSMQALMTALSGTVGLGNIAGVAVAVSVGGPGAVFWMVVMGFLGMSVKFSEVMLGIKYRKHLNPDDPADISGGPMYYIEAAFDKRNLPWLGKAVALIFAFCCVCGSIGGGNMFQANQSYQQLFLVTGGDAGILAGKGWLFGIGLSVLVGMVIIGGIKSIAAVSSKLVPVMGLIYMVAGAVVIGMNYQSIPSAFSSIFSSAFSFEAGLGGFMGGLLAGIQRAAFSNEAGLGSGGIFHATVRTTSPVAQGFVGMLGPFIDTVIICLMTALVIVISGVYVGGQGVEGVELTSRAMASAVPWFPYVLALTVFLFAYSTLIAWFYCGLKGLTYICGERNSIIMGFKVFFCLCVVLGASAKLDNIINFTDAMILSMAFPNIVGLYLLAPEVRADLKAYVAKLKKA